MSADADYVTPGADPSRASAFYVSAVEAERRRLLVGPYDSYAEALAQVDRVRDAVCKLDPRGDFMSWGTAGWTGPRDEAPEGSANAAVGR